ncbi:hypothetical protein R1sor_010122 [Riccia sorocarpa]|uniref:Fatty acyl-CoA reductase n=1 Tax=Riccia sorocarpa TaxID=122646 RepID=A0ABD3HYJ2_9MARC
MASSGHIPVATCFAGQNVEAILFQRNPQTMVRNYQARTVGGVRWNEEWRPMIVRARNLVTSIGKRNMELPLLANGRDLWSGRYSSECQAFKPNTTSIPEGEFPNGTETEGRPHSTQGQDETGILSRTQGETDGGTTVLELSYVAPTSYLHDKPPADVTTEDFESGPPLSDQNSREVNPSRSGQEITVSKKPQAGIPTTWQAALKAGLKTKRRANDIDVESDHLSMLQGLALKPALTDEAGRGSSDVLHIVENLEDKRIFITGATGFLAKVLVEKILRAQPLIGQLYLLVRESKDSDIYERTVDGIFSCSLFKPLREEYGDDKFVELILSKITPISGDIGKPGLELRPDDAELLMRDLDIIVSSAATTKFDERYDKATEINTLGPVRLLELAKKCPKLSLFQHISTAYVNGRRKGICREIPFEYGQSLLKEIYDGGANQEPGAFPALDPEREVDLALRTRDELNRKYGKSHPEVAKGLVKLGTERAKMFGWSDTYTLTKAMGEQMVRKYKGDIAVVIVRPSVVESTMRSPFDGWIEGQRMLDPIVTAYGKGFLKGFLVDPDTVLDVIPADIVVNVTLAAMIKHAGCELRNPSVYQVASSVLNPLTMSKVADACYDHFRSYPMVTVAKKDNQAQEIRVNYCVLLTSEAVFWLLVNLFLDFPLKVLNSPLLVNNKRFSKARISLKFNYESIKSLADTYKPYVFYKGRFDATQSENLLNQISDEEKDSFGYSVKDVDWYKYLNQSHLPGLRQHVLGWKQTGAVDPKWTIIDPVPKRDLPPTEKKLPPTEKKLRPPSGGMYQLPFSPK